MQHTSITAPTIRIEHDLIGNREIPAEAYWGIHTLRARENFPITGRSIAEMPDLIRALAAIKEAAAGANAELGLLDSVQAGAIAAAAQEIRAGAFHDQFAVDPIQGGAGTSTNMNANEVIANRALEHLGHPRGAYHILHPNEQVNLGQSTNDVYPTALKLAAQAGGARLIATLETLCSAFAERVADFAGVVKIGRTQLQEAVPMTLGQEFAGFARALQTERKRLSQAVELLSEINMGGTAIGTGITAHPHFGPLVRDRLAALTERPLSLSPDLIEASSDCSAFVSLSAALKGLAVRLSKICNDLRLLSSGPRAGLQEINLPARQAGSSIMPGKVNPVIPEVVNQIAFEVIGNDLTVTMAAEAGQLQLNAFEPVIFAAVHDSLSHLTAGCGTLASHCVAGITCNRDVLQRNFERSIGLATMLVPAIGYRIATEVATEALRRDLGVYEIALERGLLSMSEIERIQGTAAGDRS